MSRTLHPASAPASLDEVELAAIDAELDLLIEPDEVDAGFATDRLSPHGHESAGLDQAARLRHLVQGTLPQQAAPRQAVLPAHRDRREQMFAARRARLITIASGKGGVGKTNVAVNLAIALAARGLRVTLLDADLGTANADVLCGITPSARLDHVLAPGGLVHEDGGQVSIRDIGVRAPGGFTLIAGSAGVSRMADLTAGERRWLVAALVDLAADADVLIVDAAAGIGSGVTSVLSAADLGLIVTTPEPTAMADAYALMKCVAGSTPNDDPTSEHLALIVNQVRNPAEAFATHARLAMVADKFLGFSFPMLGFLAQDVRVPEAVRAQKPLLLRTPECEAARGIVDLAGAITNTLGLDAASTTGELRNRGSRRGVAGLVRRLLGLES